MNYTMINSAAKPPGRILPVIVVSQFAGTSLWFAGNAILPELQRLRGFEPAVIGWTTSAVQLGFILGTLVFALTALADHFSPRRTFFACSLLGALCNLGIYFFPSGLATLLVLRFLTGCCLAGIYPIGMKIASGWYRESLGNAIALLVAAVVAGTAFPFLLKSLAARLDWQTVTIALSIQSAAGGVLMLLFVPDGPLLAKGTAFNPKAVAIIFGTRDVRAAAFGYFGHMWELYAFWAFLPLFLSSYAAAHQLVDLNVSRWVFYAIAAGSVGCVIGGWISRKRGSARVASAQLVLSGLCCLLAPWMDRLPPGVVLPLVLFWGMVVVGDSPQFSALVGRNAPPELVGSALTIVTCIGFAITIVSIQTLSLFSGWFHGGTLLLLLAPGPAAGLYFAWPLVIHEGGVRG